MKLLPPNSSTSNHTLIKTGSPKSDKIIFVEHLTYPENRKVIEITIVVLIIFLSLLIALTKIKFFETSCLFLRRILKSILRESFLFLFAIGMLFVAYSFKFFETLKLNWQPLMASLVLFWILWSMFVIFLALMCRQWIGKAKRYQVDTDSLSIY